MKNLFKKLGILSLLLAILSPFVELPVKAETTNCKSYLQNYLFMDEKGGGITWDSYTGSGYRTFTSFIYSFPNENVTIKKITSSYLTNKDDLGHFYDTYVELIKEENIPKSNIGNFGNFTDKSVADGNYELVTNLLHAKWARVDETGQPVDYKADEIFDGKETSKNKFINENTYQGIILNSENLTTEEKNTMLGPNGLTTDVGGAKYTDDGTDKYEKDNGFGTYDTMNQYFTKVINEKQNVDLANWGKNLWQTNIADKTFTYISFTINRDIEESLLDKLIFGYTDDDDNTYIYSEKTDSAEDIVNSYSAFNNYSFRVVNGELKRTGECTSIDAENISSSTDDKACYIVKYSSDYEGDIPSIDINTDDGKYYMPHVMAVNYEVCSNDTSTPENTWTISYDTNAGTDTSVKNYPSAQTGIANGTNATLSDKIPTREGYKFSKWCKAATGSKTEDCYSPKAVINNVTSDITLFAYWDKTGTTENKDTGIETYIISFIAIGLVAGGIYYIAKKKNLFSQV